MSLPLHVDEDAVAATVTEATEKIAYERRVAKQKNHPGRNELPSHLPVEVTVIEPSEDVSAMKRIGEEVSDVLEFMPASLFIESTIRPRYAPVSTVEDRVCIVIADTPQGPFEKCKATPIVAPRTRRFLWGYHAPVQKLILFECQRGRVMCTVRTCSLTSSVTCRWSTITSTIATKRATVGPRVRLAHEVQKTRPKSLNGECHHPSPLVVRTGSSPDHTLLPNFIDLDACAILQGVLARTHTV